MGTPVLIDAVRTPVGRFQGVVARPDDAGMVMSELIRRNALDPALVDEVYLGCANQAGEDNRNIARMALLLAGFPQHVPGITVNRLCASGLSAVNQAARMIRCDDARLCVAGGVESMSRAPLSLLGHHASESWKRHGVDTSLGWRYPNQMEALFMGMGSPQKILSLNTISREKTRTYLRFTLIRKRSLLKRMDGLMRSLCLSIPERKGRHSSKKMNPAPIRP